MKISQVFLLFFLCHVASSNLDANLEAKNFSKIFNEHLKAKNYTIIDPEFVGILKNGTIVPRDFYVKNVVYKEGLDKNAKYSGRFDEQGFLQIREASRPGAIAFAKRNSNIRGGYTLYKIALNAGN
ncbi:unnamed protein product [Caenorhabditis angaria]|uniref:Uncharacterized protein n=1 Tax=Caenorhabditis angaria TaxID=860376 RepID=A0A9P1ND66_9PELO|nr:unnamed protein product [Caenorhabditis angaria]